MKFKVLSDLHIEFGSSFVFEEQKDTVLILAGDIDNSYTRLDEFLAYCKSKFRDVVFVPGNHEYYGHDYHDVQAHLRSLDVTMLDNDIAIYDNVMVVGSTLWSAPDDLAYYRVNDHARIRYNGHPLYLSDVIRLNQQSRDYIKQMVLGWDGKIVVATHFSPSAQFVSEQYRGDALNTYFHNSGLEYLFERVNVWAFGHTHDAINTVVDGCRFVNNPFGYYSYEHNKDFSLEKVINV